MSCVKKGRVHSIYLAIVGLFPSPSNAISSFTEDQNTSIVMPNLCLGVLQTRSVRAGEVRKLWTFDKRSMVLLLLHCGKYALFHAVFNSDLHFIIILTAYNLMFFHTGKSS